VYDNFTAAQKCWAHLLRKAIKCRQTILTRVLESLRLYLPTFTLARVIEELNRWWATGRSCFEELREKLKLPKPPSERPIIDRRFPGPSPSPTG
jgi:hypothetical protein